MLTQEGCLQRRTNLWLHIPEGIDWILLGDSRHVQYFSGFRINPLSFSADQKSLLLLQRTGAATLLADNFVRRAAVCEPIVDQEIIIPWYTHKRSVTNRDDALVAALDECRRLWSTASGLIEPEGITEVVAALVSEHAEWQFVDVQTSASTTIGNVVRQLRRCKLPDEIAVLKRCMAACDAGHAAAFDAVRAGASELDVYLAISQAAQKQAGQACVVYGDFRATNATQFKAGGLPTNHLLQDGDLFIADFSVIIEGYRSDFTNTIAVGAPTEAQHRQFVACRDALLAAEQTLRPGVSGADVYAAASRVFTDSGYPALSHHCGHGLGLEHPEPPILVPESQDSLLEGDVITIEPGLYLEGSGGMRFEHNYRITADGFERLSNHHIGLTR